jgi:mannose-6-phosphate isomerase-like protein (cupin superfamily)
MPLVTPLADIQRSAVAWLFQGRDHGGVGLSFYVTTFEAGAGPSLHLHPYPEVFLVEEGEATFTVAGEDLAVGGGNVVVVPPETAHRFVNSGAGTLRVISIHPSPEVLQTDVTG